jgi:hypothetical protein
MVFVTEGQKEKFVRFLVLSYFSDQNMEHLVVLVLEFQS